MVTVPPVGETSTLHDAFARGGVDHTPFEQVDVAATDAHVAGETTEEAEYEVQVPPLAVAEQPPVAAQVRHAVMLQVL